MPLPTLQDMLPMSEFGKPPKKMAPLGGSGVVISRVVSP